MGVFTISCAVHYISTEIFQKGLARQAGRVRHYVLFYIHCTHSFMYSLLYMLVRTDIIIIIYCPVRRWRRFAVYALCATVKSLARSPYVCYALCVAAQRTQRFMHVVVWAGLWYIIVMWSTRRSGLNQFLFSYVFCMLITLRMIKISRQIGIEDNKDN